MKFVQRLGFALSAMMLMMVTAEDASVQEKPMVEGEPGKAKELGYYGYGYPYYYPYYFEKGSGNKRALEEANTAEDGQPKDAKELGFYGYGYGYPYYYPYYFEKGSGNKRALEEANDDDKPMNAEYYHGRYWGPRRRYWRRRYWRRRYWRPRYYHRYYEGDNDQHKRALTEDAAEDSKAGDDKEWFGYGFGGWGPFWW